MSYIGSKVRLKDSPSIWIIEKIEGEYVYLVHPKKIWGLYAMVNKKDILVIK